MAVGLDIGTMFLVKTERDQVIGGNTTSYTSQRNVFLQVNASGDTEDTLRENGWFYVKYGNEFYILGEDALKLSNLLAVKVTAGNQNIVSSQIGDLRRPMKDGILNTGEEQMLGIAILQKMIETLIGPPSHPNEHLCFCSPGNPVDRNMTVIFHQKKLQAMLVGLGYDVECIPEALAIIFSEKPVAVNTETNEEDQHTGIAMSFGAGMCNVCFAIKQWPAINFSIARSGDWIDQQSAAIAGVDIPVITRYKETKFDLENFDDTDIKASALDIFYGEMIEHAIQNFVEKFSQLKHPYENPLDIVIAGGTASVPGFLNKFKSVLSQQTLPFTVREVRMAQHPLYAVSHGCFLKALSTENKKKTGKDKS